MTRRHWGLFLLGLALVPALWFAAVPREASNAAAIAAASSRIVANAGVAHAAATKVTFAPVVPAIDPARPQPPALPFTYLGRMTDDGESVVVLGARGRTFKVRGAGPLDADYLVEALFDDHLVLRYVPLDARQVLELASRQPVAAGGASAEYPQD